MTPELIRQWLADGLIDLQEAAELLNQLYARAATHERGECAATIRMSGDFTPRLFERVGLLGQLNAQRACVRSGQPLGLNLHAGQPRLLIRVK